MLISPVSSYAKVQVNLKVNEEFIYEWESNTLNTPNYGTLFNGSRTIRYSLKINKIDKLKIREYMKTIIISEDVNIRKPDPKIFQFTLAKIQSNCETTLFVGDNPMVDIKGAIDSGLISVWLSHDRAWNIKQFHPTYIIDKLSDLMQF